MSNMSSLKRGIRGKKSNPDYSTVVMARSNATAALRAATLRKVERAERDKKLRDSLLALIDDATVVKGINETLNEPVKVTKPRAPRKPKVDAEGNPVKAVRKPRAKKEVIE